MWWEKWDTYGVHGTSSGIVLVEYGIRRERSCAIPTVHVCEEFSVHFDLRLYVLYEVIRTRLECEWELSQKVCRLSARSGKVSKDYISFYVRLQTILSHWPRLCSVLAPPHYYFQPLRGLSALEYTRQLQEGFVYVDCWLRIWHGLCRQKDKGCYKWLMARIVNMKREARYRRFWWGWGLSSEEL